MDRSREDEAADASASTAQRVSDGIEQGRAALADMQTAVTEKSRACLRATDSFVHDHPWQAIGMAAGVGLLIGLLMGRR